MEKVLDRELNLAEKEGTGISEVLYRLLCEESAHPTPQYALPVK